MPEELMEHLINFVLSFDNITDLVKDTENKKFDLKKLYEINKFDSENILKFKEKIFYYPFNISSINHFIPPAIPASSSLSSVLNLG